MIEKTCDIVVLGAGGSGMVAAVRAAERGCRVIVLEKAGFIGGGMLFASTMRTFQSKWQAERGIPDQANAFMRRGMDETLWRLDPDVVSAAILGTGKFFDWYSQYELPEVMAKYYPRPYVFDIPVNGQPGPQIDDFHNGSGRYIMETMKRRAEELGVEILTKTPAADVETRDGRLAAVLSEGPEGPVRVEAKAFIFASGGWICRRDIAERVLPAFLDADILPSAHENPAYTGEAIDFGEKLGADIDWENFCFRIMGPICALGDRSQFDVLCHIASAIVVDMDAKRFTDEPMAPRIDPFATGQILVRHPKARTYTLFSKNLLEAAIAASRDPDRPRSFEIFDTPELPPLEEIDELFRKKLASGSRELGMADSIGGLAEQIGLDPAALRATVDEYNAACAAGVDWKFCKDPENMVPLTEGPFYALACKMATDGAFGGIRVNADMQALSKGGTPIAGLFVTGDAASGKHISLGGLKKQVLNDMSWALSSGYIAGAAAADSIR